MFSQRLKSKGSKINFEGTSSSVVGQASANVGGKESTPEDLVFAKVRNEIFNKKISLYFTINLITIFNALNKFLEKVPQVERERYFQRKKIPVDLGRKIVLSYLKLIFVDEKFIEVTESINSKIRSLNLPNNLENKCIVTKKSVENYAKVFKNKQLKAVVNDTNLETARLHFIELEVIKLDQQLAVKEKRYKFR